MNTQPPELTMEKVLSAQHAEWLGHPVTQQLIKNIKELRENLVTTIASHSVNQELGSELFRAYGYGIKNTDTILRHITSTSEFINKSQQTK